MTCCRPAPAPLATTGCQVHVGTRADAAVQVASHASSDGVAAPGGRTVILDSNADLDVSCCAGQVLEDFPAEKATLKERAEARIQDLKLRVAVQGLGGNKKQQEQKNAVVRSV